jgi:hypothetical protein
MPHSEPSDDSIANQMADKVADPEIGDQDELDIDIAMEDVPAGKEENVSADRKKTANLAEDLFKDDDLDEAFASSGATAESPVSSSPGVPASSAYVGDGFILHDRKAD